MNGVYCVACGSEHQHTGIREFLEHHFLKASLTVFGLSVMLLHPVAGLLVLAAMTGQWATTLRVR